MTTSILRLGYTESDLLLTFYIANYSSDKIDIKNDIELKNDTEHMLNWFYKTSGFYDKSINNIDINCFFSNNFVQYMTQLINTIKDSTKCFLNFHEYTKKYYKYFGEFVDFLNNKVISIIWYRDEDIHIFYNEYKKYYDFYRFIENKKILIINPLSDLMYSQYKNGNVYNANNINFSEIKDIIFYKNQYTFFNNGPNSNNIETLHNLYNELKQITADYDCAIISCGSYSCLIAGFITKYLNKDVFVIGGTLNEHFALKTQRLKESSPNLTYNEFWIDIPEYMKPHNYKLIENGCYW
jgi:hypothetical protein